MLRWLGRLRGSTRAAPTPEALRNDALELAMDWGEDWLAPIHARLRQRHPQLSPEQLDALDATARQTMQLGQETAYRLVREHGREVSEPAFASIVLAQQPWLRADNASRLFRQSMYYAWKTGRPG